MEQKKRTFMKNPLLSVVIPVFGCCESLSELCRRIDNALTTLSNDYEIILVNDASPDGSWELIKQLAAEDERVKGINFSRNFGQHYAITAGLDHARGDWVVVMDCDLQDSPEEILALYNKAQEGYDLVVGLRSRRHEGLLKKATSKLFYLVFNYLAGARVDNRLRNFGIYARKVVRSISRYREQSRSFGLFALAVGFRRAEIDIDHSRRASGESSYSFRRRLRLAFDSIVSHSNRLLWIFVKLGLLISLFSMGYACYLVVGHFVSGNTIAGWTSVMVSIYFTAGLIIGTVGIVGLYVGKVFDEVKGRPLYIIESTTFEADFSNE